MCRPSRDWCGLAFKPRKCASLHLSTGGGSSYQAQATRLHVQQQPIPQLAQDDLYKYLGKPLGAAAATGQPSAGDPDGFLQQLRAVQDSLLAPWQKLDALRTFLIPQLHHLLRLGAFPKHCLQRLDRAIVRFSRACLHLPTRSSVAWLRMPMSVGGAGIPCLSAEADLQLVCSGYKLLCSPDPSIRAIARADLSAVVAARAGAEADPELIAGLPQRLERGSARRPRCWPRQSVDARPPSDDKITQYTLCQVVFLRGRPCVPGGWRRQRCPHRQRIKQSLLTAAPQGQPPALHPAAPEPGGPGQNAQRRRS